MARTTPQIKLEEISGDQFPDIYTAQNTALPLLSANLQNVISDLLTCGALVNVNGKIIPNPKG
jgi:hypothetical protein